MSAMEQDCQTLPPPQTLEMESALESTAESSIIQMPEIEQHPKIQTPQRTLERILNPRSTTKPKAPTTRADWVNTFWADVSAQLRRFSVISNDLFDGLLLKRDTVTGSLILGELVSMACFAPSFAQIHWRC